MEFRETEKELEAMTREQLLELKEKIEVHYNEVGEELLKRHKAEVKESVELKETEAVSREEFNGLKKKIITVINSLAANGALPLKNAYEFMEDEEEISEELAKESIAKINELYPEIGSLLNGLFGETGADIIKNMCSACLKKDCKKRVK